MKNLIFLLFLFICCINTCTSSDFTSDQLSRIIEKNKSMGSSRVSALLPFVHNTILSPIGDGIKLEIPENLGNKELAKLGIVDASAKPFYADPTGKKDSTKAIIDAANFARDNQMACYFPVGRYKATDTLEFRQNLYLRANLKIGEASNFPNVIIGSTKDPDKRTVFFLDSESKGFTNPDRRKIFVHFNNRAVLPQKYNQQGSNAEQANINYRQFFSNIDIEIGEGNSGAVGIRMQAAEGSSIQDCTINATHGLVGMLGAAGSGGSHHNITVIGGRIGIDTRGYPPEGNIDTPGTQPTPTMAHITLINQTETAVFNRSRGPLIGVGWKIITDTNGPVIKNFKMNGQNTLDGSLCLIDSSIEFSQKSKKNTVIDSSRSFYFNNVFIKNCENIFNEEFYANEDGWIKVKELANPIGPGKIKGISIFDKVIIDNKTLKGPYYTKEKNIEPPENLQSKHIWGKTFPYWDSPKAVNVKGEAYNARGDGKKDDTIAIQNAIDENEIVFFPKGIYRITKTLKLKTNTKLIGLAQNLSIFLVRDQNKYFSDEKNPKPVIETVNAKDADTVIAFLGLFATFDVNRGHSSQKTGYYALKWMCGGKSIFRSNQFTHKRAYGFEKIQGIRGLDIEAPFIQISGNGGGKWYNFFFPAGSSGLSKKYRHILIENNSQQIHFYHLHAQGSPSEVQMEIRNSKYINIYGIKTEYETGFMRISNSSNIRIFGHGGIASPVGEKTHYYLENVTDFLFSNFNDQPWFEPTEVIKRKWSTLTRLNVKEYNPIVNVDKSGIYKMDPLTRPILFKIGNPD